MFSAALTIALELRAAPAWTIAVCPSREIETPGRRRDHALDGAVGLERPLDVGDDRLEGGVVDRPGRRVEHRHQRVARQTVEVLVDQLPGLHGLRAGGLPPGARQRGLHARGEEPEADRDYQPGGEHDPEVGRGVAAEPADRADVAPRADTPPQRPEWRASARVRRRPSDRHLLQQLGCVDLQRLPPPDRAGIRAKRPLACVVHRRSAHRRSRHQTGTSSRRAVARSGF